MLLYAGNDLTIVALIFN